jgi:lysozyme family protein
LTHLSEILVFTFAEEGGYQDDPEDSGNWLNGVLIGTNMGISAAVLAHWRHSTITAADMRGLELPEATAIAGALFGNPMHVETLLPGPDLMVFELAWCSGVRFGATALQTAVGAAADGFVGPETLAAAATAAPRTLIAALDVAWRAHCRASPGWATFGQGWMERADRRLTAALARLTPS